MFKVVATDQSKDDSEFVIAACNLAWEKVSSKDDARQLLADRIRDVLDRRFGPSWNVLCGSDMGFALKSRKKNSAILAGPRHIQLVIWRSPAHEIYNKESIKLSVSRAEKSDSSITISKGFKVISRPQLGDSGYLPGIDSALPRLDGLIQAQDTDRDLQILAKSVRAELTLACGPIWHVVAGENFFTSLAKARQSEFLVKKGNVRVLCFRHAEVSNTWPGLTDLARAWKSMGFIILVVAYFMNRKFCEGDERAGFCPEDSSAIVTYASAIFLGLLIAQFGKTLFERKK